MSVGSVHVHPSGTPAWGRCELCPSWSPEFPDELKAREIVEQHLRVSHGLDGPPSIAPMQAHDLVIVVRMGSALGPPAVLWLADVLGRIVSQALGRHDVMKETQTIFSQNASFIVQRAPHHSGAFTAEEVATMALAWHMLDHDEDGEQ